jgi:O-antigen/teichoic acid export membrane protein
MIWIDQQGEWLTAKDIRLQYSGFVIFAAKMVSVSTGLIFQFMVARVLSEVEYDLWFNINDITAYFVLMAGVLPFWTMRFVARDKEGAV